MRSWFLILFLLLAMALGATRAAFAAPADTGLSRLNVHINHNKVAYVPSPRGASHVHVADILLANLTSRVAEITTLPLHFLADGDDAQWNGPFVPVMKRIRQCSLADPNARIIPLLRRPPAVVSSAVPDEFGMFLFPLPQKFDPRFSKEYELFCDLANVENESWDDDYFTFTVPGALLVHGGAVLEVYDLAPPPQGTLIPAVARSAPAGGIVDWNWRRRPAAAIEFRASLEPFEIDTLTLSNCLVADDVDGTCLDQPPVEELGDDALVTLVTIEYPDRNGRRRSVSAPLSGGRVRFTGLGGYVGSAGSGVFNASIDTPAAQPVPHGRRQAFQLNLNARQPGAFRAVGQYSGQVVTEQTLNAYVPGARFEVVPPQAFIGLDPRSPTVPVRAPSGFFDLIILQVGAGEEPVTFNAFTLAIESFDPENLRWNICSRLNHWGDWMVYDFDTGEVVSSPEEFLFLDGVVADDECTINEIARYMTVDMDANMLISTPVVPANSSRSFAVSTNTWLNPGHGLRVTLPTESELSGIREDCADDAGYDCDSCQDDLVDDGIGSLGEICAVSLDFGPNRKVHGDGVVGLPVSGHLLIAP